MRLLSRKRFGAKSVRGRHYSLWPQTRSNIACERGITAYRQTSKLRQLPVLVQAGRTGRCRVSAQ